MTAQGSATARRRSKTGNAAEQVFELVSRTWDSGLRLWKIPRGLRVIGSKGGKLRSVPAEKTGPDYLGVYKGNSVAVEVKSCATGRLPLSVFAGHQVADLADHDKRRGVSYVAVVSGGKVYMVPWCVVKAAKDLAVASVPKKDVERFPAGPGWTPHLVPF